MKYCKPTFLSLAFLFASISTPIEASEIGFSYTYGNKNYSQIGTKKAETYDVAILISDESFVGDKIVSFCVPMVEDEDSQISNVSVWISKQLTLVDKVNAPDILSVDAEIKDGKISVVFPDPIEIPAEGLYVGYSFTVDKKNTANETPVFVAGEPSPDGLFFHTSKTYLKWKSQSENWGYSSAITVGIEGNFSDDALCLASIVKPFAACGEDMTIKANLINYGAAPLDYFEYSISDGNKSEDFVYRYEEPLTLLYGQSITANLPYVAPSEIGEYNIVVDLKSVNGKEPVDGQNKMEAVLDVFQSVPVHKPLMEEYTGLWCGWCPRGFAALEAMNHLYPEDFIGISYHNNDQMERIPSSAFPNAISGFPAAYMDRTRSIDAYSGISPDGFGIEPFWQSIHESFTPAFVNGSAIENSDGSISVKSDISFVKNLPGSYKVAYEIVANGLTDEKWGQNNNYDGYNANLYIPEMQKFCDGKSVVFGLVFDDIFAAGSDLQGEAGSLISDVVADQVYSHEYSFASDAGISTKGYDLFSNAKSLYAVIILLDENGAVVNSNKVLVENHEAGVNSVADDLKTIRTDIFDISGRKVENPSKGIFIKVDTKENGEKHITKIIR